MCGVLRAEPLWVETFTGLRMDRFVKLVKVVRERGGNGPGGGRPWCLPLEDRVLLVAVYYRTDLTMRQLAPLFGVSPATVCRVIQRLRPLLAIEPASRPADAVERLWISPGRDLLPGEEEDNAEHRRVRARVEHAFARMKHYKILRDCRQRGTGLHHAVQAVAHMHNLAPAA
ncbi:transposase family protein [Streptomyces sp. NPDC026092]|uniref:transposase family protein n=1 Tax=Streptomyces sp. NPDC026092 TaxID=3154797 RepID=UPI0033C142CF